MAANELAYGFVGLEHIMAQRIADGNVQRVFDAIRLSTQYHTEQVNALLGSMVRRTTEYKKRYMLPGGGTLQPLDANGNPLPVRDEGYYDVAFPIQGGGTAWADDRVSRALMTVEEANRRVLNAQRMDANWLRRHIFGALFFEEAWTWTDPLYGNLSVQPLANGDTVTYLKSDGTMATDDHYLAQAAAIADVTNPYDDIYDELAEHPVNAGADIVCYIPTALKATTMALTAFIEVGDPDLRYGVSTDQVGRSFDRGFGDEVLGKVNKCWIVEWKALPATHMIAHARGTEPVLWMREYEAASLQGFFPENFDVDGNHQGARLIRYCGFGVANRVGAVVQYIGSGTYAEPTGYDSLPLPA